MITHIKKHWKLYLENTWYLLFVQALVWGANWWLDWGIAFYRGDDLVVYIFFILGGLVYMTKRNIHIRTKSE